jgi:hypothetical protein
MPSGATDHPAELQEPARELSAYAKALLTVLVEKRRDAERRGYPDHAWLTKSPWLQAMGVHRGRKDALRLIGELLDAGFVESRDHGAKGGWHQYCATTAGMAYLDELRR